MARSRPTRARGLKLDIRLVNDELKTSRPTRARGLKPCSCECSPDGTVAPHAGAWIEPRHPPRQRCIDNVAPHAGAWIETLLLRMFSRWHGRAPRGRVD